MNRFRVSFLAFWAWVLLPASLPAKPKEIFYYVPFEDGWQSLAINARKIPTLLAEEKTEATHNVLVDEAPRRRVISDSSSAWRMAAPSLQVDLEGVPLEDATNYTEFVREAVSRFGLLRPAVV